MQQQQQQHQQQQMQQQQQQQQQQSSLNTAAFYSQQSQSQFQQQGIPTTSSPSPLIQQSSLISPPPPPPSSFSTATSFLGAGGIPNTNSKFAKRPSILDKPLSSTSRGKSNEVSLNAWAFMFSELLQYSQKRVSGIQDLEKKLSDCGYRVGIRFLELIFYREKSNKRDTRLLQTLMTIHSVLWKVLFGKVADSLEKSTEQEDEYMISDNEPLLTKFISVPKEMSSLNCGAFVAGILEAVCVGSSFPAKVTAHSVPIDGYPLRTTFLIKFNKEVIERDQLFDTK